MEVSKNQRVLSLYSRLLNGEVINKLQETKKFCVNARSIQRDIQDLRKFMEHSAFDGEIIYNRKRKGYVLNRKTKQLLSNGEILAVCKILLESRAFVKSEIISIIDKLLSYCESEEGLKSVTELISDEKYNYIEPYEHREFIDMLWDMGVAVNERRIIEIEYFDAKNNEKIEQKVFPVGILFSEYYFYLNAFIYDTDKEKYFESKHNICPTRYRIDRIKNYIVTNENFYGF